MGRTTGSFYSFGTVPVDSKRLVKLVIVGLSISVNCLSKQVGIESSAHVLDSGNETRLETNSTDTLLNEDSSRMHVFARG